MENILLVEDDPNLSLMIQENLEDLDFVVYTATSEDEVFRTMETTDIQIILMDVELNGNLNGFDIAEIIRSKNEKLPIIFTTARKEIADLQRGFNIGNMDYLKKPFGIKELSFRINALLQREHSQKKVFQLGIFTFDPSCFCLYENKIPIKLARLESIFLSQLFENKEKVVSKEALVKSLWEREDDPQGKDGSLHNIAYKIRKILEKDPSISLKTIAKNGYLLSFEKRLPLF